MVFRRGRALVKIGQYPESKMGSSMPPAPHFHCSRGVGFRFLQRCDRVPSNHFLQGLRWWPNKLYAQRNKKVKHWTPTTRPFVTCVGWGIDTCTCRAYFTLPTLPNLQQLPVFAKNNDNSKYRKNPNKRTMC